MTLSTIDIRTDTFGQIISPILHDAVLKSFSFDDGSVCMGFAREETMTRIAFNGAKYVGVRGSLEGTIILSLSIWKVNEVPDFVPEASDNPWKTLLGYDLPTADPNDTIIRLKTKFARQRLVHLSASYGADISLLCDHAEIQSVLPSGRS